MNLPINYIENRGREAKRHLDSLAKLRIEVFRYYPYLYVGDRRSEEEYLATYFSCDSSFIVLAQNAAGEIVGATTAIFLKDAEEAFRQPFVEFGYDINSICYFGESVLLPQYRGLGVGKAFMRLRLNYAKEYQLRVAAFCAVQREDNHPKKPEGYRPLDTFWQQLGFNSIPGMTTQYSWKDIGEAQETPKTMQFWLKNLT